MKELTTLETELVAGGGLPATIVNGLLGDSFTHLGEFAGETGVSLKKEAAHVGINIVTGAVHTGLDFIGDIFSVGKKR